MNVSVFGRTYTSSSQITERIAELEAGNAKWGASDDRVTELNLLAEALPAEPAGDVYTVERDEFESPCEHPLCDQLHRRFMTTETVTHLVQGWNSSQMVTETIREHSKTVRQWVVLRNGKRVADAYDTKREALAAAARRPQH